MEINFENTYLTKEELDNLENELHYLKQIRRPEIGKRLQAAVELGDIPENSEYDEAKADQEFNERKIVELERLRREAKVYIQDEKKDSIQIGDSIEIKNLDNDKIFNYIIVGDYGANIKENKISYKSPLGKVLLNKKVNDIVELSLGENKTVEYLIINIRMY